MLVHSGSCFLWLDIQCHCKNHHSSSIMKQNVIIAIVCIAVAAFTAGWVINGWRLSADSTTEKISAVQANADHFADVSKKVNASANEYLRNTEQLKKQITELKKELANAKKNNPLPADCRPDADRLRVLKDAVRAANSTTGQ